jgi:hypothetical protein
MTFLYFVQMPFHPLHVVSLSCKCPKLVLLQTKLSVNVWLESTICTFRDLNPLYDTTEHKDYREKYFRNLMPLIHKYSEVFQSDPSPKHNTFRNLKPSCIYFMCSSMSLIDEMQLLPWGGKITSESLRFFSPIVIWTIFEPTEANHQALYSAFVDYYKVRTNFVVLEFCLCYH